jgi:hypothetical protein
MQRPSLCDISASSYEFNDPSTSSSDHELHFHIMGMVQDRPFFGAINENPYFHLEEFEELCSRLVLPGMTQESIWWKLFPLSLSERAEQWYTDTIKSVNGDWGKLRDNFCNSFSLVERTVQWYTHKASLGLS